MLPPAEDGSDTVDQYALPKIPALHPIKRMPPSIFIACRSCKLRGALKGNSVAPMLPSSPYSHLGSVAHQILTMASMGKIRDDNDFEMEWERLVAEKESLISKKWFEKHFLPLRDSAPQYALRKSQCKLLSMEAINRFEKTAAIPNQIKAQKATSHLEVWLQAEGGKIGGYPDAVIHTEDGFIIIDYKTGKILDDSQGNPKGIIKEDYAIQLKLYAALLKQSMGSWPSRLLIISLDGAMHEVPFNEEECTRIIHEALNAMANMNNVLALSLSNEHKIESLAEPSPKACRRCEYRPGCLPYLEAIVKHRENRWPDDVFGEVCQTQLLANKKMLIKIKSPWATDLISIRGLDPERHPALSKVPKMIYAFGLSQEGSPIHFKDNMFTTIYG